MPALHRRKPGFDVSDHPTSGNEPGTSFPPHSNEDMVPPAGLQEIPWQQNILILLGFKRAADIE
jgi:hypothetical protein